jgi:hopanoid biosynthesis associated radical SAM protein HpnH
VGIPLKQIVDVGSYIVKKELSGTKRYPLVLMMEPLFRCNLACAGCGKIDYPDEILNKRISYEDAMEAVDECGAPVVVIAGGEPLIHKELPQIVRGIMAKKKYAIVCTNAILLEKKMDEYEPSPYFTWSIHLDGDKEMHDKSVCRNGIYDKAVSALKEAKRRGFRVTINCTFFQNADPDRVATFFDEVTALGVDGMTVSPGYAYERAPDQQHFLNRQTTKNIFRKVFSQAKGKGWQFNQSTMFLDFLAGNQNYKCTPWGNPTRTVFGWQKPCYLLGEGYAKTFKELMDDTNWDNYGVGNYEKCADCMVHSGFEASAVRDTIRKPWKAAMVSLFGIRTTGPMAPEIPLHNQRPAEYVFSRNVAAQLDQIKANNRTTSIDTEDHQELVRSPDPVTGKPSVAAPSAVSTAA